MRISDWSSDVCSSDLQRLGRGRVGHPEVRRQAEGLALHRGDTDRLQPVGDEVLVGADHLAVACLLADAAGAGGIDIEGALRRSEEHTSELQSLMRISYAACCLKTKN